MQGFKAVEQNIKVDKELDQSKWESFCGDVMVFSTLVALSGVWTDVEFCGHNLELAIQAPSESTNSTLTLEHVFFIFLQTNLSNHE